MNIIDIYQICILACLTSFMCGVLFRAGIALVQYMKHKSEMKDIIGFAKELEHISEKAKKDCEMSKKAISEAVKIASSNNVVVLSVNGKEYTVTDASKYVRKVGNA